MMHLLLTTPSGTTLLFDVMLTGAIDLWADGFTVNSIEIRMWGECARLTPTGAEPLPVGHANAVRQFWVRPDDLCWNGTPFKHEELIAEAAKVREALQKTALHGPLGENWP